MQLKEKEKTRLIIRGSMVRAHVGPHQAENLRLGRRFFNFLEESQPELRILEENEKGIFATANAFSIFICSKL